MADPELTSLQIVPAAPSCDYGKISHLSVSSSSSLNNMFKSLKHLRVLWELRPHLLNHSPWLRVVTIIIYYISCSSRAHVSCFNLEVCMILKQHVCLYKMPVNLCVLTHMCMYAPWASSFVSCSLECDGFAFLILGDGLWPLSDGWKCQ